MDDGAKQLGFTMILVVEQDTDFICDSFDNDLQKLQENDLEFGAHENHPSARPDSPIFRCRIYNIDTYILF